MSHSALYRTYRPQKFSEVVGQDDVVAALSGALKDEEPSHAYLFYGTRGTGKTSVARIFASELGAKEEDIHEIDAASYTGVDNIRALREEAAVMPFASERKVYIVDEVHMLSRSAFNAFLKLLEEPPAHVVFILATTELEKVPDTILSRCQVFTFRQPTVSALVTVISRVAKAEKYELQKGAAELVALVARGSFRDALSHLQKVFSTSDKKVTEDDVARILGAPRFTTVAAILNSFHTGEPKEGLAALQTAAKESISMDVLCELILDRMRTVLLLRYAPEVGKEAMKDYSDVEQEFVTTHAKDPQSHINSETLRACIEASVDSKRSPIAELPLELALIEATKK